MNKKEQVLKAIDNLFGEISVPAKETLEALQEIADRLEDKIACLKADLGE